MEAQAAAGLPTRILSISTTLWMKETSTSSLWSSCEELILKSYITKKGHLEVKEAIGIAIQVASGIEAAHEQGYHPPGHQTAKYAGFPWTAR